MMKLCRLKALLKVSEHNIGKLLPNVCFVHGARTVSENSDNLENATDNALLKRSVPCCINEYKARKDLKPCQPENPHLLKVALLGEPNVGKSTLTNSLVKWKVCAVSKKVHTTRSKAAAILVEDNKQIVFLDTPGFVTPEHSIKHHLEVSLVADPESSVREADLICVIIDSACKWTNTRIHEDVLKILDNFKEKKSILVLNKVDIQKGKHKILKMTRILTCNVVDGVPIFSMEDKKELGNKNLTEQKRSLEKIFERTEKDLKRMEKGDFDDKIAQPAETSLEHSGKGWPLFSRVFMVSALSGDGVDALREYLLNSCKPRDWLYHDSSVIDKNPYDIAISTVREKLLDNLPDEIPYNLSLKIKSWELESNGSLKISIVVRCPKPRYKQIVIGHAGKRIGKCVEESRQALQDTFRTEILLNLLVR